MKKHKLWFLLPCLVALAVGAGLRAERGISGETETARRLAALQKAIAAEGLCWEAGDTSMSRLSDDEQRRRLGARLDLPQETVGPEEPEDALLVSALPSTLDWRNRSGNWVSGVRDQGSCGSCWAFATVGALESLAKIVRNIMTDIDLSEETLVHCSGAGDCDGGYMNLAAEFLRRTGAPREDCYPYSATDGSCKPCPGWMSKTVRIASRRAYANASKTTLENVLLAAPIAAYMEVYSDFYNYRTGIYERTAGATYKGGHGILIVGYNNNESYWICKNSWGTDWGENGFFRIRMGNCKIASYAVSLSGPSLANQAPALQPIPAQAVDEGKPLAFTLSASDPDYDTLFFSAANLPAGAQLDADTGAVSWTPSFTQAGVYAVKFTVTDGLSSATRTATITVTNVKYKKW